MQVLIGQPFDLVKVRTQILHNASPLKVFKDALEKEGPSAFYKGTLAPLFGVGFCVSLQFYGFLEAKRQILSRNPLQPDLSLPQFYCAGAFAGIVNTPITCPVEQVRILLQTQPSGVNALYKGPSDAVRKVFRQDGFFKGLNRGFGVTLIREAQAYGVWFLTYEYLIQRDIRRNNIARRDISTPKLLLYGATAGEMLWLSSYPLDVIKSRIQSDSFGSLSKYGGSAFKAGKDIMAKEGVLGFWRGIGPTLLRAIPCSAGTFASVEFALRMLG